MSRHISGSECPLRLGVSRESHKEVCRIADLPFVKRIHFKQQTPCQEQFHRWPKQDPIFMNYRRQCWVCKGVRDLTCDLAAQDQPLAVRRHRNTEEDNGDSDDDRNYSMPP